MFDHYLALGGNEIVNSERAHAYAKASDCPIHWLKDPKCDSLAGVVGQDDYASVQNAPWYDDDIPDLSSRFLGLYGVELAGLSDSTREASVTERTGDGAVVTGYRHGSREVRVRAWMTANGKDALEYGMTWLRNVLEPNACGMHGGSCGASDSAFFVDCPPARRMEQAYTEWETVATNRGANPSLETPSGTIEVRRNLVPNPEAAVDVVGFGAGNANTGGITSIARVTGSGPRNNAFARKTWTTGETAAGTLATMDFAGTSAASAPAVSPSTQYTMSVWFRSSQAETVQIATVEHDSGGAATVTGSASVAVAAGVWTRLSITRTTLATTATMRASIRQPVAAQHPINSTWDLSMALLEVAPTAGLYFTGTERPRVRENLHTNPKLATGETGWARSIASLARQAIPASIGSPGQGIGYALGATGMAASGSVTQRIMATMTNLVVGRQYTVSGYIYRTGAPIISGVSQSTTGSTLPYIIAPAAVGPGAWERISGQFVATATTMYFRVQPDISASGQTSDMLLTGVVVSEGVPPSNTYFDGDLAVGGGFASVWTGTANASSSYQYDTDFTTTWVGTANNSASTLTAPGITGVNTTFPDRARRIQSTRWADTGTKSVRVIPITENSYAEYGSFAVTAGETYTILARLHLEGPQTGTLSADARKFVFIGDGLLSVPVYSETAPNAAGDHWVRATVTAGATASNVQVRLMNGSNTTDAWWDSVLFTEGEYLGPYFDGNSADDDLTRYSWNGAINNSISTWEARTIFDTPEGDDTYFPWVDTYRRFLHSVRCISGPFTVLERESSAGKHLGRLVEFTLLAEVPYVFGLPKEIDVPPIVPTVVQDIAYNLAPYPSAELSSGPLVVATNYSLNPSVETNATGWTIAADGTQILAANVAGARVTGELAAVGTASFRSVFTAPSAGAAGFFGAQQVVDLPVLASARYSVNMWASGLVITGTPVVGTIQVIAYWQNASNVTLRTDVIGSQPLSGGPLSAKSIAPPAGATKVVMRSLVNLTSWAAGDVVRLYSDALAVTNP